MIVRPSTSKQLMIQEIKRSVSTMPCLCPTQPQNLCSNLTNLTLLGSDLICGRVFAYMRRLTPDSNLSQLPTLRIKAIPRAWKIVKLSSFSHSFLWASLHSSLIALFSPSTTSPFWVLLSDLPTLLPDHRPRWICSLFLYSCSFAVHAAKVDHGLLLSLLSFRSLTWKWA